MPDNDPIMRRIHAQSLALADQGWRALEDKVEDILRIGMYGPDVGDHDFVKRVFILLGYEVTQRQQKGQTP